MPWCPFLPPFGLWTFGLLETVKVPCRLPELLGHFSGSIPSIRKAARVSGRRDNNVLVIAVEKLRGDVFVDSANQRFVVRLAVRVSRPWQIRTEHHQVNATAGRVAGDRTEFRAFIEKLPYPCALVGF